MHVVVHLLVKKSPQNDLIEGELQEVLYVTTKGPPKISLEEAQKFINKCEEKYVFGVALDGLTMQSRVHL